MDLGDLITPYGIIPVLKAGNKKLVLHELSARAAELTSLDERDIFNLSLIHI